MKPLKPAPLAMLVAGNVALTFLMLAVVNLLCLAALAGYRSITGRAASDDRWTLPVHDDPERARLILEEVRSLTAAYEPFVGWTRLPFSGATVTVGENGDRGHRPPSRADAPSHTVRFFGGSTMWGIGVDDQGTIPALYNEVDPLALVTNHGESGFNSRQGLDRLISLYATGWHSDVVVFYDGVNEVFGGCQVGEDVPSHGQAHLIRNALRANRARGSARRALAFALDQLFLRFTRELSAGVRRRLTTTAQEQVGVAETYDCDTDPQKAGRVADALLVNWELAHAIVTSHGGRFIAILQPNAHVGAPRIDHLTGRLHPELGRNYRALYPLFRERIARADTRWMLDWAEAFDVEAPLYIDDFHVVEAGNRLIAGRIHDTIRTLR